MPMYEYECKQCGGHFDLLRSMSQDDSDVICKACGSAFIQRRISRFAAVSRDSSGSVSTVAGSGGCTGSCSGPCSGGSCTLKY